MKYSYNNSTSDIKNARTHAPRKRRRTKTWLSSYRYRMIKNHSRKNEVFLHILRVLGY